MTTFEVNNKLYKTSCKYSLNNRNKGSKGLLSHTEHVSGDIRQQGWLHEGALQPLPTSNYDCSLCHGICDLTLHLKETTALNPFISTKLPSHDLCVSVLPSPRYSCVTGLFLYCSEPWCVCLLTVTWGTFSAARALMSGPCVVVGSEPCPSFSSASIALASFSMKASWIPLCTKKRLEHTQVYSRDEYKMHYRWECRQICHIHPCYLQATLRFFKEYHGTESRWVKFHYFTHYLRKIFTLTQISPLKTV